MEADTAHLIDSIQVCSRAPAVARARATGVTQAAHDAELQALRAREAQLSAEVRMRGGGGARAQRPLARPGQLAGARVNAEASEARSAAALRGCGSAVLLLCAGKARWVRLRARRQEEVSRRVQLAAQRESEVRADLCIPESWRPGPMARGGRRRALWRRKPRERRRKRRKRRRKRREASCRSSCGRVVRRTPPPMPRAGRLRRR